MRRLVITAILAGIPGVAGAEPVCAGIGGETLFHCTIRASSREVSVCGMPDGSFLYRFGEPGAPELELNRSHDEVIYTPWNGVGSAYWARLGFRNEGYLYDVGWSIVKDASSPAEGFVDIYKPGTEPDSSAPAVTLECRPEGLESGLEGLWERFQ